MDRWDPLTAFVAGFNRAMFWFHPLAWLVERKLASSSAQDLRGAGVVLVVDDEAIMLRMAKLALERYGYRVELSSDGEQAVKRFRERPDEIVAVLLDMAMPVVSGEDAFEQIKRIRPDVPVIVSSGYSEQVARQRFRGSGEVAGFLQKPYTAAQLGEQICGHRYVIRGNRAHDPLRPVRQVAIGVMDQRA